ncbi:hypothetical protein ACVIGB_000176 [Bradyrhizobium sp. USDA 4341]
MRTVFDSPAWHGEIERRYVSLKYDILEELARETTLMHSLNGSPTSAFAPAMPDALPDSPMIWRSGLV